ncbi:unnamed protein product [Mytilus edulis]|uniref:Uncharacterized protein n=1 Tax=Mytilus edulis TaxID=6550 RepID=A0A8S3SS19_MYTED|nr:unnamed protein product [Mytilus edulis]
MGEYNYRATSLLDKLRQCQDKEMMLKAVAQRKIKLVKLLLHGGVDVNFQGYDGKTPLIVACSFLHQNEDSESMITLINLLIKGGANTNAQDMKGRTALMYAVRHVLATDIIQQLLDNGADPNILDDEGRNTYYYIRRNIWPRYKSMLKKYLRSQHDTLVTENSRHNHGLQQVNDYHMLYHGISHSNDSQSIVTSSVDNIYRRASDSSAPGHPNKVKLLPKRKCKSYSYKSGIVCNLIHEENENDNTMEGHIEEFCKGKQNKQRFKNQLYINKNDYQTASTNKQFLTTLAGKTTLNNFKNENCLKSRKDHLQHCVSDVDKTIVKTGIKGIPEKLPPIS